MVTFAVRWFWSHSACFSRIACAWSLSATLSYSKCTSSSGPFSPLASLTEKSSPVGLSRPIDWMSGPVLIGWSSGMAVAGGCSRAVRPGSVSTAGGRLGWHPASSRAASTTRGTVRRFMGTSDGNRESLRPPVGLHVVARARGQRVDVAALAVRDRDLPLAALAALAREDEVAAIGSPRWVFAAAAAGRDLPDLPGGQVDDRDVEPARFEPRR